MCTSRVPTPRKEEDIGTPPQALQAAVAVKESDPRPESPSLVIKESESESDGAAVAEEDRKISEFSTPPCPIAPTGPVLPVNGRDLRIVLHRLPVTEDMASCFPCTVCEKLFPSGVQATEHTMAEH